MNAARLTIDRSPIPEIPAELVRLRERIEMLPPKLRRELTELADDAVDGAVFRSRVMAIAKEGLERYRLDLALLRFDLDATRREREAFRTRLKSLQGD